MSNLYFKQGLGSSSQPDSFQAFVELKQQGIKTEKSAQEKTEAQTESEQQQQQQFLAEQKSINNINNEQLQNVQSLPIANLTPTHTQQEQVQQQQYQQQGGKKKMNIKIDSYSQQDKWGNLVPTDQYISNTHVYQQIEKAFVSQHALEIKQTEIIDVWEHNLEAEMYKICQLVEEYNVVAMDTEFPGVTEKAKKVDDDMEFEYQLIRENVNCLKIIQLGLALSNDKGEVPQHCPFTWQFNFSFDLATDQSHQDAIDLLKHSGINFDKFKKHGCSPQHFAEQFIQSNVIFNDDVSFVCFHGGFDFAYLLKVLTNEELPDSQAKFMSTLKLYFPMLIDIKVMIREFDDHKHSGLNKLADDLGVRRIGNAHQAGSDSLVTLFTYFKLKANYPDKKNMFQNCANMIYGIGPGFTESREYLWNYQTHYFNEIDNYGMQYNMNYNQYHINGFAPLNNQYYPAQNNNNFYGIAPPINQSTFNYNQFNNLSGSSNFLFGDIGLTQQHAQNKFKKSKK